MQILFDNTGNGELSVQIDSLDDLWVLYNILNSGDQIKGRTFRRVVKREGDSGERRPMTLAINVEKVEFHEFTNRLRVLGSIFEGPEDYVSTGQHHTFNLEPGRRIRIYKESWFKHDIQRIRRNLNKKEGSVILAMGIEKGLATVALLSNYSLTPITEIRENIPGKRFKKQGHQEAVNRFYEKTSIVVAENINRHPVSLVTVCGPSFTKVEFAEYFKEFLAKSKKKMDLRTLNASSGEMSAIYEVLRNGSIAELKSDFRIANDEMLMAKFIENLSKENNKVAYGLKEVVLAGDMGAIEDLLICDILLRNSDVKMRTKVEEILNIAEKGRGKVHILSTSNPAGDQLASYGKIAAILRFGVDLSGDDK